MSESLATERQLCDLMIRNGFVITMNPSRTIYASGALAVRQGAIVPVGQDAQIAADFERSQVIDAHGAPVHPGFFDCHAHLSFHLTRGVFPDLAHAEYDQLYKDWQNTIEPEEEHASALLACLEMLH